MFLSSFTAFDPPLLSLGEQSRSNSGGSVEGKCPTCSPHLHHPCYFLNNPFATLFVKNTIGHVTNVTDKLIQKTMAAEESSNDQNDALVKMESLTEQVAGACIAQTWS